MTVPPSVVDRATWLKARRELLDAEKELTRLRDELNADRRALPWVQITKPYTFDTPDGAKTLADLFDGRNQLLIYHFMMGPDWAEGCPTCSFWADNFDGIDVHLADRDTTFLAVSRADRGVPSSHGVEFRVDFVEQQRLQHGLPCLVPC